MKSILQVQDMLESQDWKGIYKVILVLLLTQLPLGFFLQHSPPAQAYSQASWGLLQQPGPLFCPSVSSQGPSSASQEFHVMR